MGGKTHTSAVVVIPPDSVWGPIQQIRKRHDRQFRRWMPHINLVYPFRPEGEFDSLEPGFRRVCSEVLPFDLRLEEVHSFGHRGGHHTLWLEPRPASTLTGLREALAGVVPDCEDLDRFPSGFTPHLSLGQARGRAGLETLLSEIRSRWSPLRFRVDAICFIVRGVPPDDVFRVARRIPLGTG